MLHEQAFYREPLLLVLHRRGGSATRSQALAAMEEMLADVLTDDDRVPRENRGDEEGWRNCASWEVKDLKDEGYLLPTHIAGRGNWALSDTGHSAAFDLMQDQQPGTPYIPASPPTPLKAPEPFDIDPDLVDRGRTAHHRTMSLLAQWILRRGLLPLSPTPTTPQYDLAWTDGTTLNVAEIKSVTDSNEERQLRLGLGQVLRYRHLMSAPHRSVVAWLVPERAPADPSWNAVCDDLGAKLAYPPHFA